MCSTGRGLPLDEDGGDLVDVTLAALDARAHRHVDLLADLVSVLLELQEELHVGDPLETRPADRPVGVVLLQMKDAFTASFIFDSENSATQESHNFLQRKPRRQSDR